MIGYYVHHQGRGHLHRATALARELHGRGQHVTGLSSLPEPADWPGGWVRLAADDDGETPDPTAGGRLHWAPSRHPGLRSRMAAVSAWIASAQPSAIVVDVSVEVLLLARLHGVPTVGVVLPGVRDDAAHRLGFGVADELVAFWPPGADGMVRGLPDDVHRRVRALGALSRHECVPSRGAGGAGGAGGGRDVVLLGGSGGHDLDADALASARRQTPDWTWTALGPGVGAWVDDPSELVRGADVVVTHAGQNAIAEVAAARRPAVVLPQRRPFAEQATTASVLAGAGLPVLVRDAWPATGWPELLQQASGLAGGDWVGWCDGGAVHRFGDVLTALARAS